MEFNSKGLYVNQSTPFSAKDFWIKVITQGGVVAQRKVTFTVCGFNNVELNDPDDGTMNVKVQPVWIHDEFLNKTYIDMTKTFMWIDKDEV